MAIDCEPQYSRDPQHIPAQIAAFMAPPNYFVGNHLDMVFASIGIAVSGIQCFDLGLSRVLDDFQHSADMLYVSPFRPNLRLPELAVLFSKDQLHIRKQDEVEFRNIFLDGCVMGIIFQVFFPSLNEERLEDPIGKGFLVNTYMGAGVSLEDAFFNSPEGSLLYNYEGWDPRYGIDKKGLPFAIDSFDDDFKHVNEFMWNSSTKAKRHQGKEGWVEGPFDRKFLLKFKQGLRLLYGRAEEILGKGRRLKFPRSRDQKASPELEMGKWAPRAELKYLRMAVAISEDLSVVFNDHEWDDIYPILKVEEDPLQRPGEAIEIGDKDD